jgi:3-dehydroquinate synthase
MKTLQSDNYLIYFNDTIAELAKFVLRGKYSKVFILTDENTEKFCLPVLKQELEAVSLLDILRVDAGEESKTIEFCIEIWRRLIDLGADRKSLLINLGGGVVSDMGGFSASTFKRGIDFVHVPTTLLSQVDASVGGKTGIDIDGIKNIIGTFTQPKAVFICYDFLKTLPARQILSGLAEMLKHGIIADVKYWNTLIESDLSFPNIELIYRSIEIKNDVVLEDPTEQGLRKCLNFGHTIGHAVETYSLLNDANPLSHGEAIAIGMICEAYISKQKIGLSDSQLADITSVLNNLYPKYEISESIFDNLLALMQKDKKNKNGKINCTLIQEIGKCSIDHICTVDELYESLRYYKSL